MPNTMQKFRQNSIVFEKSGILSENLKTLTSSNYPIVNIFCWNFANVFYLPVSTEEWGGYFFLYLHLKLFAKFKKDLVLHTRFLHFINNSRSKQNKKNPTDCFVDISK